MIKYRKKDLFIKFGIGSRLLEVLYVKSNKKTQVPICLFELPICLIEVPNCLGAEMSHIGAEVSWCRFVPVPKSMLYSKHSGTSSFDCSGAFQVAPDSYYII